jgi:hypothetical protein
MNFSTNHDDKFVEDFIAYFGIENIPNPNQYPKRFEFLLKSYEHYKKMKDKKNEKTQ